VDTQRYIDTLLEAAEAMDVACTPELAARMAEHQALVDKWAKRINLTTVTEASAAAVKHGLDCLLFTTVLTEPEPGLTVDIGSGGGFPGLILALAQPQRPMVLLEPIRKRTSFLRAAAAQLKLDKLRVVEGRLEADAPARGIAWPVSRIVSRATIPPLDLVPLSAPYLAAGGELVLTSGAGAPSVPALQEAAAGTGLSHTERREFTLPGQATRILDRLCMANREVTQDEN